MSHMPFIAPDNTGARYTDSNEENRRAVDRVARNAMSLGRDIAEIAAAFDALVRTIEGQKSQMVEAHRAAETVQAANEGVLNRVEALDTAAQAAQEAVANSVSQIQATGEHAREIAAWVQSVARRMSEVTDTLSRVQSENSQIRSIASQVNILAINAKIEAVRAGDAGRGFAVVAEAINELSGKTARAAEGIGTAIGGLATEISELKTQAGSVSERAEAVLSGARETDTAMGRMTETVKTTRSAVEQIAARASDVRAANAQFAPAFRRMEEGMQVTGGKLDQAQKRTEVLILSGESILQDAVMLGAAIPDSARIERVKRDADRISARFEAAIASGEITEAALFDTRYQPVQGSNPQQVLTGFTTFTDRVLPEIQEAALSDDPAVVFCAAVDRNGYLPTHNRKFSQRQGADPVWNAANSRNRRIFDDRVGKRAGQSEAPFLLQVYLRDMGGGKIAKMKDLSAPITVHGRHWGGLRLAYMFD